MAWIDSVVPGAVIRSVWGNAVRDRVVQTFDSIGEANSHLGDLPDGAMCVVAGTVYLKRSAEWWPMLPRPITGRLVAEPQIGAATFRNAECVTPPRYRTVQIDYHVLVVPSDGVSRLRCEIKLYVADGGSQVGFGAYVIEPNGATLSLSVLAAVNPNGDKIAATMSGFNNSVLLNVYNDSQNHRLDVMAYPDVITGG